MKGVRVEEAVLIENVRQGGVQSSLFCLDHKIGWRQVDNLAWVPEIRCLVIDAGSQSYLPEGRVMVVPEANVASMVFDEQELTKAFFGDKGDEDEG